MVYTQLIHVIKRSITSRTLCSTMSLTSVLRFICFNKNIIPTYYAIQVNNYAVPGVGGGKAGKQIKKGAAVEKKLLPVEKDVNRLLTYVCGTNIYKEGGEDVKLKPDSEYPDWLWNIKTSPVPLEELDPNTKLYWRRIRRITLNRKNKISASRKR